MASTGELIWVDTFEALSAADEVTGRDKVDKLRTQLVTAIMKQAEDGIPVAQLGCFKLDGALPQKACATSFIKRISQGNRI